MGLGQVLLLLFVIALIIKVPIGITLMLSSLGAVFLTGEFPIQVVLHRITGGLNNFTLLAIPFFILAGNIMNRCGITDRIFNFAEEIVGYIPGGIAHSNVVASIIFSGMSGAAVADAGGLGLIEMKAMKDRGYPADFSGAVTAASSTIGPIIPPSIPMVVYAVAANASLGKLFIGGIIPGVIMGLALMVIIFLKAKKEDYGTIDFNLKRLLLSFKDALLPLLTPIIIVGGILIGIFTPTEAAVIATAYALILALFIYKNITFKDLIGIIIESMETTATVTFIIAGAEAFAWLVAMEGIPRQIANAVSSIPETWMFLIIFNIFFLILGTFMETLSIEVIMVPVLVPIYHALGLDPIHMGVVLVLNLMIGLITPPIGMALFVTSKVGKIKLENLYKEIVPFIIPLVVVLLLITYIPELVTWLPKLAGL